VIPWGTPEANGVIAGIDDRSNCGRLGTVFVGGVLSVAAVELEASVVEGAGVGSSPFGGAAVGVGRRFAAA
jgi:hypothetical protein